MAKDLELYLPAKPFVITQGWGIANPSYAVFGFTKHNGVDFIVDEDEIVRAMCNAQVIDVGFNNGAGNYVTYRTVDKVMCEGAECYVVFMCMHAAKTIAKNLSILKAGDPIMIAGNTGFSTGPHTHISSWRVDEKGKRLDLDPGPNYTFDWRKYLNGFYADHAPFVELFRDVPVFKQLLAIMKKRTYQ